MAGPTRHIDEVGRVVESLDTLGLQPVLVGGMALVTLGSRRVTRDFDFIVATPGDRLEPLVQVFYDRGFELASRLDESGEVVATIDNPRVAVTRLRIDTPVSAFFLNPRTRLRVDLLFDFPEPAAGLASRATRLRLRSHEFHVASEIDLLRLKILAQSDRAAPGDAEDVAFLEALLKRTR